MPKDKIDFHVFNIDDKWLKMILNGEKRSEVRRYCLPLEGKKVGLMNNNTAVSYTHLTLPTKRIV